MNLSFGTFFEYNLFRQVFNFAFINNATMVASSGSTGSSLPRYPGSYDDLVIRVGASGENGNHLSWSNPGEGMDLIALGLGSLYSALDKSNTTDYSSYNLDGTSFSCPHVAGCASLLLSHYKNDPDRPNELSNEDIENLLQNYAVDIAPTNWDQITGWGRVNIGQTMKKAELPKYKVRHYSEYRNSSGKTLMETGKSIEFPDGISGIANSIGYTGIADVYKLSETFYYTLPGSEIKLDLWVRNASSNATYGYCEDGKIRKYQFNSLSIEDEGENYVKLVCYFYDVDIYDNNNQLVDSKWFPSANIVKFAFSVHTDDTSLGINEDVSIGQIKVFPNPTNNLVNIEIMRQDYDDFDLQLFDIQGKQVYKNCLPSCDQGLFKATIDLNSYKNGVYILKVSNQDNIYTKRIIKSLLSDKKLREGRLDGHPNSFI